MFHALAAALLFQSPNLDYTTEAVPLSRAIAAVSKLAGKKLRVGDDLANEPIILRLKQIPVQDALDKIAETMGAEWTQTDQGPMLTRTEAAVQRLLQERKTRRLAGIQKGIAAIAKAPPLDAVMAEQVARQYVNMLKAESQGQRSSVQSNRTSLSYRTADARLMADILKALGPDTLAQLPPGAKVYAVDPTPTELPIPGITQERIDEYVTERNVLATALKRAEVESMHDGMIKTGIQQAYTPIAKTPIRVIVDIYNSPSHGLNFYLNVYDGDGRQVTESSWSFERADVDQWFAERPKLITAGMMKPGIKLPPDLVALGKRAVSEGPKAKPLTPGALQLLLRPDLHDPLSLGFSQLMLGTGEMENLNVVATANDLLFITPVRVAAEGEYKPDYMFEALRRWERQTFERKDGWLLSRPSDLLYATATRMDRPSLAEFMRATQRDGFTSLETWADLAVANPNKDCANTAYGYRSIWVAQSSMYDYSPWSGYRLYGLLAETQRDALQKGQSLPYGSLSEDQRQCVADLTYNWDGLHSTGEATAEDINEARMSMEASIQARPTESLPDGVPNTAQITMSEAVKEKFFVSTNAGPGIGAERDWPMEQGELANMIAQQQRPDLFPPGTLETVNSVRYGHQRTLTFKALVTPTLFTEARLIEERKPTGDPIAVADLEKGLPASVWEKLNDRVQELLAIYKRDEAAIRKSRSPKKTPPPPPP